MEPVRRIEGRAVPLGAANIDTDIIIPARFLKTVGRAGLGRGAFATLRAVPGNVIDANAGAPILIAGENFGCGSSREHAAWALLDLGIRAVIAPSFADIFASNAFKNGIVTAALPQAAIDRLLAAPAHVAVDLEALRVEGAGGAWSFALDPFRRHCLLSGLDEIALTLAEAPAIARYEAEVRSARPWVGLSA